MFNRIIIYTLNDQIMPFQLKPYILLWSIQDIIQCTTGGQSFMFRKCRNQLRCQNYPSLYPFNGSLSIIFYKNMKIRNFALFILIKTSLIVSNEYQNTLCHKKVESCDGAFYRIYWVLLLRIVHCYKILFIKIFSENPMNQIRKTYLTSTA